MPEATKWADKVEAIFRSLVGDLGADPAFVIPHKEPWPTTMYGKRLAVVQINLRNLPCTYEAGRVDDLEELGFLWRMPRAEHRIVSIMADESAYLSAMPLTSLEALWKVRHDASGSLDILHSLGLFPELPQWTVVTSLLSIYMERVESGTTRPSTRSMYVDKRDVTTVHCGSSGKRPRLCKMFTSLIESS